MTPYQAQRLRFGILAARHYYARETMSGQHMDDLDGMELSGWRIQDSLRAYDRECLNIHARAKKGRPHVWIYPTTEALPDKRAVECEECGRRGTEGFVWYQGEIMLCRSEAACDLRKARRDGL